MASSEEKTLIRAINDDMIIATDTYDMHAFYDEVLEGYLDEHADGVILTHRQLRSFFKDLFFIVHWRCHDQLNKVYSEFVDVTYTENDLTGEFSAVLFFEEEKAEEEGWSHDRMVEWVEKNRAEISKEFFEYRDEFLVQFIQSYDFAGLSVQE